ncbi:MAG: type II toxin-antitoxin system mRNA interferase toxin, RelE/StbE family [Candidatus Diapherotrites archaeon]|nr:type II toxin-antitoxin system mRNA interferase toxin, RelE/StbE family [Candidatus Diapherotrites archaeon]
MEYSIEFTPTFEKSLKKLNKKNKALFQQVQKKMNEIVGNPSHYKPLKNPLAGCRRVHAKSFVITFEVKKNAIKFLYVRHHDKAYK